MPKLLAANETVVLIPTYEVNGVPQLIGDTTVPLAAPTSAVINKWLNNYSTAGLANGGNISQAIKDDLKLSQIASSTDKDRAITSFGKAENPTFYNFQAQFNGFADADPTATGIFNLWRDLTFCVDAPYAIAQRIGYKQNVAAAAGQIWNFFYAWTDHQIWALVDEANLTIGETFVPKNLVNLRYTLAA